MRKVRAQDLWFAILDAQTETGNPYMMYKVGGWMFSQSGILTGSTKLASTGAMCLSRDRKQSTCVPLLLRYCGTVTRCTDVLYCAWF